MLEWRRQKGKDLSEENKDVTSNILESEQPLF